MQAIKQEPVEPIEWPDFDHENASIDKSNIEVAVKPEMLYSKEDTDEEGKCHTNNKKQNILKLLLQTNFAFVVVVDVVCMCIENKSKRIN